MKWRCPWANLGSLRTTWCVCLLQPPVPKLCFIRGCARPFSHCPRLSAPTARASIHGIGTYEWSIGACETPETHTYIHTRTHTNIHTRTHTSPPHTQVKFEVPAESIRALLLKYSRLAKSSAVEWDAMQAQVEMFIADRDGAVGGTIAGHSTASSASAGRQSIGGT